MLSKLKTFLSNVSQGWNNFKALAKKDFSTLWNEYRGFIIFIGGLVLLLKFRELIINFLLNSAKNLFNSSTKTDQTIKLEEDKNNQAANNLVKEANDLPNQEKPVDENWYKNE
jgi:hypothetical protein